MRRVLSGKREHKVFLLAACVAFACCLCLGACAVQQSELSTTGDAPMASETDAGTAILSPHAWKDQYPNQYASYIDAGYETYDDRQPDAHGKVNTFFSATHFSNMTPETGCMRCHTSEFSSLVKEHGDGLFAMDFTDFRRQVTVGVTCYSCHGNNPGELTPANTWVIDAAKRGGIETDEKNLVCAQCHALPDWGTIMDNPDPSSWSMLQFGLDADAYWEHYEASGNENPIVPAEEMEFNNFVGSIMEKAGATCVDCHMPKAQSDDGTMYSVHIFKGPDCNEELYENCLGCHTDSTVEQRKAAVEEVKADYETRRAPAQAAVDELASAIERAGNSVDASKVEQATVLLNKATFYLNYGSDWGSGIHNMGNPNNVDCFEDAIAFAEEGTALLA